MGLLAGAACDIQVKDGDLKLGMFSAEAKQEWTRTYPLPAGGHVEIANVNGPIQLTAGTAGTVEVRADISAKSFSDDGAKDILSKGKIEETVTPDRVKVQTITPRGVRGSYVVRYHVRLPAGVDTQVTATNGRVTAAGLDGTLKVSVVNGNIELTEMAGGVDAAIVNGTLAVKMANLSDAVRLETTNGRLSLEMPKTSKANLSARVVNGGLNVVDLPIEEQRGNRIRNIQTQLNGGGPDIDLRATNGRITITGVE